MVDEVQENTELLKKAYAAFNARDLDGALATMLPDVVGPTGWRAARYTATMVSAPTGLVNGA